MGNTQHLRLITPPVSVTGGRVLLVDSNRDTRFLYRAALQPLGAIITEAEDGAEALGRAMCDPPAVLVTETTLPRIDGVSLCGSLRRQPVTADIHIVVVTASPEATHRALVAGANHVLIKPYPIGRLIAAVRSALRDSHQRGTWRDTGSRCRSDV